MKNSVTIIIPTQGRPTKLAKCLAALARQENLEGVSWDVIVAVDGGDRSEFEIPREAPPRTRYLRLPNLGAAAARNAAVEQADGELLIFSNDDTYPRRDWVRQHLLGQERRGEPGMVLGHTRWMAWPDATVFDGLVRDTSMVFFYNTMEDGKTYGFRHFWTCNASLPAKHVREVGGFNTRLRPVFFEDCEIAFRIERAGRHGVFYHAAAVNVHDHRLTWSDYSARERMLGTMAVKLAHANPSCFAAIYGDSRVALPAGQFAGTLALDAGDIARAEVALKNWLDRPLASVESWPELRETLYALHLPIKRRLFRESFVAAASTQSAETAVTHPNPRTAPPQPAASLE